MGGSTTFYGYNNGICTKYITGGASDSGNYWNQSWGSAYGDACSSSTPCKGGITWSSTCPPAAQACALFSDSSCTLVRTSGIPGSTSTLNLSSYGNAFAFVNGVCTQVKTPSSNSTFVFDHGSISVSGEEWCDDYSCTTPTKITWANKCPRPQS